MIRSRYEIELRKGVKVEMLFTLALFGIAKKRGISLDINTDSGIDERLSYYVSLMYCAAILAWEYKRMDDPAMGDFPYKLIDFAEWSGDHPLEFSRIIKGASSAIAGREMEDDDAKAGDVKKK